MKTKSIAEVCEIISGGTPKTSMPEYWNGSIGWLSVKDFGGGKKYVYESEKTITELGIENSSTNILNENDIILSARGTVGEMAMIGTPMAFNQSCFGLRTKDDTFLDQEYLYYALRNSIKSITSVTQGSVFETINRASFDRIYVSYSDINTQRKVAAFLSDIDSKIETNTEINRNLSDQGRAIFEALTSGREVNAKLEDLISNIETGSRPKGGAQTEGVPSIGAEKIEAFGVYNYSGEKYVAEEYFEKLKKGHVLSGDVLLYKDGAYTGKSSMALDGFPHERCAVNEHVFKLNTKENKYQFFLYFTLDNKQIRDYIYTLASSKAAQPGLNQAELLGTEIVLPDAEELDSFEVQVSEMMHLIASNAKENKRLAELRDQLLPKLMSGEIDVSDLDI